ncbi:MAG: prolipoprotein diacylglyceryl transferase [Firmicutes bacterium]|nr:prolipoprotein diacylglyceryl transferase [Bacillota bacterium]
MYAAASGVLAFALVVWCRPYFLGQRSIDPVLLRVGPVQVRWYGFLIAMSFIPGFRVAAAEARRKGIDPERLYDFALLAGASGFAGARLAYVVQNLSAYLAEPLRIVAVWEGGLSMHGVIAGGLAATAVFARRIRTPFLTFADVVFPALPLGQAIGRWGNFFNQELFGYPTDVPWKMYVAPEFRPPQWADESFFHPTFLYESLWNLAVFGLILWYRRRPAAREGDVLFLYVAAYSAGRFWVEFFRIGVPAALGLTLAQLVSLGLVALCLLWLPFRSGRPLKNPPPATPARTRSG